MHAIRAQKLCPQLYVAPPLRDREVSPILDDSNRVRCRYFSREYLNQYETTLVKIISIVLSRDQWSPRCKTHRISSSYERVMQLHVCDIYTHNIFLFGY